MKSGRSQPRKISLPLWVMLIAMFALVTVLTSWAFGAIVQNIATKRLADEYTETVTNTTRLLIDTSITPEMLGSEQSMQTFVRHWARHDKDLSKLQLVDTSGEKLFEWLRDETVVKNPIYLSLSINNDGVILGEVFAQWRPDSMIKEVNRRASMAQRFGVGTMIILALVFFAWTHWLVVRPVVAIDRRLRAVVSRDENAREKRHWISHELSRLDNTTDMLDKEIRRREEAEQSAIESSKEAMAANVAKSRFLANMSHELRTPLNSVIGYSEMIIEDVERGDNSQIVHDAGQVHSAGEHLLQLINDVLDLSKIEAGKVELINEEINVEQLLADCVKIVQPLAEECKNKVAIHSQSQSDSIVTDSVRFKQVICNLLSNACKFTKNGNVTLTTDRYTRNGIEWFSVSVTDTGIGIEADRLEKMFEEFSQAEAATSRQYGGTGLGLAISRKLCELMGGSLSAQSEEGKGSSFVITIPRDISKPTQVNDEQSPDYPESVLNATPA